jgi:hypothetical protein
MSHFEDSLQKILSPRLTKHGYEYNPNLRSGEELFGYSKNVGVELYAVVQFQRRSGLANDEFTINLLRVKASPLQARSFGGYAGASGARLSQVLWYVHELRSYPASEHWWAAEDRSGLEANLIDAADQIEKYGLAWIENPNPPKPWEMPEYPADQFIELLNQSVMPDLDRVGYRAVVHQLNGRFPYPYFVKSIGERQYAIIEFQQVYSIDPKEFIFDVRLQRVGTSDPLEHSGDYAHWQNASLGQLAWQVTGLTSLESLQSMLWHYADRAELADRLRDALAKLKQFGLPWLESIDLQSSVIQ